MKKTFFLLLMSVAFYRQANCQITKGNWMMGGSARISRQLEDVTGTQVKAFTMSLMPDIGYFIIDKFAVGSEIIYSRSAIKNHGYKSVSNYLAFGPHVRYYWLSEDHTINYFSQVAMDYEVDFHGHDNFDYLFTSGAVLFFNSSVGLELTGNYSISNSGISGLNANTLYLQLGFRIHLEKPDSKHN